MTSEDTSETSLTDGPSPRLGVEVRERLKLREIWIKRGRGRRAQWGRLTGKVERTAKYTIFWAERAEQGGVVPLLRNDFVLKRADRGVKFVSVPSSGRVKKGIVQDRSGV